MTRLRGPRTKRWNQLVKLYTATTFLSLITSTEVHGAKRFETLDSEEKYKIGWEINKDIITFEVTVQTLGYVGFGISTKGGMTGADIVIGGVYSNGTTYFQDRYAEGNEMPKVDKQQDWTLIESMENNTSTYLKFSRPIKTCDSQDVEITGDGQRFIWAIGQDDNIKYHESERGAFGVNILDPPSPDIDLTKYEKFDATMHVTMPPKETTYWCTVHRSPHFTTKQHTIGFGPKILGPVAQKHSHHLLFCQCKAPDGQDPETFFEPFILGGGEDCFSGTSDRTLEIYKYCTKTIYSWALGAQITLMPKDVGFPLSDGGREYFLLEMHLNNPGSRANISFKSGVEIYHTHNLREQEAAILALGKPTDWKLLIPPNSKDFHISAHCTSACSSLMEPEGYTLFNVRLHAHTSARKMRLRHFRNGRELPWIADDQTYDNNFQNNRNIPPVKFMPGDQITLECGYDNTWLKPPGTVIGGYATREEMCATIIYYYPKGRLSNCGSDNIDLGLLKLIGINRLSTRPNDSGNPKIISPREFRGMRVLEYMDSIVNWTTSLRNNIEKELTVGPHDTLCVMDGIEEDFLYETVYSKPPSATYPETDKPYKPKDQCLLQEMEIVPSSGNSGMEFRPRSSRISNARNSRIFAM